MLWAKYKNVLLPVQKIEQDGEITNIYLEDGSSLFGVKTRIIKSPIGNSYIPVR